MSSTTPTLSLKCRCGSFSATVGQPLAVLYCHCNSCRSLSKAPFVLVAPVKPDTVEVTSGADSLITHDCAPVKFISHTCSKCGEFIYNTNGMGLAVLPVETLKRDSGDAAKDLKATLHINYADRVVDVADDLPKFLDFPEAFGGSGKQFEA